MSLTFSRLREEKSRSAAFQTSHRLSETLETFRVFYLQQKKAAAQKSASSD